VQDEDQRHFDEVAPRLARGTIVPFLGAGASLCDRGAEPWKPGCGFLPSGIELAEHLADSALDYVRDRQDLMQVAQYVAWTQGEATLYELMHGVFDRDYPTTSLHRLLGRAAKALHADGLPHLLVVTMNYDDLVERAFADEGLRCDVVWYEAKLGASARGRFVHRPPDAEPLPIERPERYEYCFLLERPAVLKLHGSVARANALEDSYVITEDDYIDYMARGDVRSRLPLALTRRLTRSGLLFLGYSLSADWDMRATMEGLKGTRPGTIRSWSVLRRPSDPRRWLVEQTLWNEKSVDLVYAELRNYAEALSAREPADARAADHDGVPRRAASRVPRPWAQIPYPGLVPYGEDEAQLFFGRELEVENVITSLLVSRVKVLTGPGSAGRTSVLRAGVVAGLRAEAVEARESPVAVCQLGSWRGDPARELQAAAREGLLALTGEEPPSSEGLTLVETLRLWTAAAGATLLLVLDQFEDYFLYHPNGIDADGRTFARELARIVNDVSVPIHVLISIREESLGKLDVFEGQIPRLSEQPLRIDHLDLGAARLAIEGPIARWNAELPADQQPVEIDPALVDAVLESASIGVDVFGGANLEDSSGARVEAPFLQLVLAHLWRAMSENRSNTLSLDLLQRLGGAQVIVEGYLGQALGRLTVTEQDIAADCFAFLVTRNRTRIAQSASYLAEWVQRPEREVAAVLDRLSSGDGARILRCIAPAAGAGSVEYELFLTMLVEPILEWRRGRACQLELDRMRRRVRVLLALVVVLAAVTILALARLAVS
jgi:hypothetical protein